MLAVKAGVQPPAVYIDAAIANVSEELAIPLTITSGLDGRHSAWSGHYQLRARNIRSRGLTTEQKAQVITGLQDQLSRLLPPGTRPAIYVALHGRGTRNEHIHVQLK